MTPLERPRDVGDKDVLSQPKPPHTKSAPSIVIDDPTIWTRTWTAAVPLTRTGGPMYEYACHEGNARSVEEC